MKKIIYYFVLVLMFTFSIDVYAGVCDGFQYVNGSSYCDIRDKYTYDYASNVHGVNNKKYFATPGGGTCNGNLGYPYIVSVGTYSGTTDYASCIDPGLAAPDNTYHYARELNISKTFDRHMYQIYQYYVNELTYAGVNDNNKNKYLSIADVLMRLKTRDDGVDVLNKTSVQNYKNYLGDNLNSVYDYFKGRITYNQFSDCYKNYATQSSYDEIKSIYNDLSTKDLIWNNPLEVTNSYEKVGNDHIFKFTVKFSDGSNYFSDYNIGYGTAYFNYSIKLNDGAYASGNAKQCKINGVVNSCSTIIADWKEDYKKKLTSGNDTLNIEIVIDDNFYREMGGSKSATVGIYYETYNPMSSDNVFINNDKISDVETTSSQRMVVYTMYKKVDKLVFGAPESEQNVCVQNGNSFVVRGVNVGFKEYLTNTECGCGNVDKSILSEANKDIYKEVCTNPSTLEESFSGDLGDCHSDSDLQNINYEFKNATINTYCKLNCKEDVTVEGFVSSDFKTNAGVQFSFDRYPKLDAKKECNVDVDYTSWKQDYNSYVSSQVSAYNSYLYAVAVESASSHTAQCGSDENTYTITWYTTPTYKQYSFNSRENKIIQSGFYTDTWGRSCCSCSTIPKPTIGPSSSYASSVINQYATIDKHFDLLRFCNDELGKFSNDRSYYNFKVGMNFYYEQNYLTIDKTSANNERVSVLVRNDLENSSAKSTYANNYNIEKLDDSLMEKKETLHKTLDYGSETYNLFYKKNEKSYDLISSALSPTSENVGKNVNNNYYVKRGVQYAYEFSPSVYKYADSYSGKVNKIANKNMTLSPNQIYLGNVYDTDVSAIIKPDNNIFYKFTSLGGDMGAGDTIYEKGIFYSRLSANGLTDKAALESFRNSSKSDDFKKDTLVRKCTYAITNEIINCIDGECPNISPSMKVSFNIVDTKNIDPNDRINQSDKGFENWKDKIVVKEQIESDDTFNPENLEYSFTLDSKTIKSIREYNELRNGYDDYDFECEESGNYCKSDFIEMSTSGSGVFSVYGNMDSFGKIMNGREKWVTFNLDTKKLSEEYVR